MDPCSQRLSKLLDYMNKTGNFFQKYQWEVFFCLLFVIDLLMLAAAFRVAFVIRFYVETDFFIPDAFGDIFYYQRISFALGIVWVVIATFRGLYHRNNLLGGTEEYGLVFGTSTLAILGGVALEYLTEDVFIARGWLTLSWFFTFFFVALGRFMIRRWIYLQRGRGYYLDPIVIVGANAEGILMGRQLAHSVSSGFKLVGYVDNKFPAGTEVLPSVFCLGQVTELRQVVEAYGIKEIILATSAFSSRDHMIDVFNSYGMNDDIRVRFSSGLYETITTGLSIREFSYVPLVEVNPVRLTGLDSFLKSSLDYFLLLISAVIVIPLCLALAILVKLDSPGPVIYRRRVIGRGGQEFDAFKFRTMHVNGDEILKKSPALMEELERTQKLKVDPRVTRVGSILRKLSLDELPQLFNVLRGEMSIVGPRMITAGEMEYYQHWSLNMLTVRPGITGLWQTSGRSDLSYEERVRLDLYYIRNWSIWLDLKMLLQTIPAVLLRKGAY